MYKHNTVWIFRQVRRVFHAAARLSVACASVQVFAVLAALPLCAAELAHRWSFNGDWSDSVGGSQSSATACGTYVSLYGNRVHMGYGSCTHGSGYVNLGTNMLDTTAATIEIWARHDGVERWSRVFDYGADDTHYFTLCWTWGENLSSDRAGAKNGTETPKDDTMAPYEIGVDYYIAVTFKQNGDATDINWQRRDARTGAFQKSGSVTMPSGIHNFTDPVLYLGHSQYTLDRDALAAYDEVRVWSGVLTDGQIAASAAAGPDATIAVEEGALQFTAAVAPEPPAQRAEVPNGGFRLMTYNIQFCYDEVNTIIPDRTAARIIAENPDFCCVNEVRDSTAHPEATVLAKVTGMHKSFGGNADGSNGNLILSKEEPLGAETVFLKMSDQGWGDRYCLICEFTNFCVAVTHLDVRRNSGCDSSVVQASNAVAIATIRDAFAKYAKPIFLCGDWNTRPSYVNMELFKEFLEILSPVNGVRTHHGHSATGGSVLDYISVDKAHEGDFFVKSSYVVEDIVTSDHNPVVAELYRRPAASALGWVDERILTTGRTGTWSPSVAWDGGTWTAELAGENVFTPGSPSGGTPVTMTVTAAFDSVPVEESVPGDNAQGALRLGVNGSFQVWTAGNVANVEMLPTANANSQLETGNNPRWVDVEAEGVTPQAGVEYTFRVVFDYAAGTYSVEVQTGLTGFTRLREKNVNPVQDFPLAAEGSAISAIRFAGDGALTSIRGEYVEAEGFSEEDEVLLKDNAPVILDKAKAAWINKCTGGKSAVAGKIAAVSADDFQKAYLLNFDITRDRFSYTFEITGIAVLSDHVTIEATLHRTGETLGAINGTLNFYGAATVEAFKAASLAPLKTATLSEADVNGDEKASVEIDLDGETPPAFFKANIE